MKRPSTVTLLNGVLALALAIAFWPYVASSQDTRWTRPRVQNQLAQHRGFFRSDMRGLDLRGLDFRGADLTEANLRGANLTSVSFTDAILSKANLSEAQLSGALFSGAQMDDANFRAVIGVRVDLSGAKMRRVILDGADLEGAKLEGTDLTGASLLLTNLRRANLARAVLDEARLVRTDLRDANLTAASLRRARIIGVDVAGADVRTAVLVSADIEEGVNLEAAQNHASVIYDEPRPQSVPTVPSVAAVWTARIHFHQSAPVEVESWSDEGSLVFYVRNGVTHGIPSSEIAKIVTRDGRVLRDTPQTLTSCLRPGVGDSEEKVSLYAGCVRFELRSRTSERQGRVQTIYATDPRTLRSGLAPLIFYVTDGKVTEVVSGVLDPSELESTRPKP